MKVRAVIYAVLMAGVLYLAVSAPLTVMADGSDPMPLCRHKGCGPFKAVERSTVLQDGSDPMPICRGKRCF